MIVVKIRKDNDDHHHDQAKAAEAAERAAFCRGELEEVLCFFLLHPERCFAIIFFRMSVQIVPDICKNNTITDGGSTAPLYC